MRRHHHYCHEIPVRSCSCSPVHTRGRTKGEKPIPTIPFIPTQPTNPKSRSNHCASPPYIPTSSSPRPELVLPPNHQCSYVRKCSPMATRPHSTRQISSSEPRLDSRFCCRCHCCCSSSCRSRPRTRRPAAAAGAAATAAVTAAASTTTGRTVPSRTATKATVPSSLSQRQQQRQRH